MAGLAAGFVVRGDGDNYLSRSMRYILHKDHGSWGATRAWVHKEDEILKGGTWATEATRLYPARYNSTRDITEIVGDPIPFHEFVASRQPAVKG